MGNRAPEDPIAVRMSKQSFSDLGSIDRLLVRIDFSPKDRVADSTVAYEVDFAVE